MGHLGPLFWEPRDQRSTARHAKPRRCGGRARGRGRTGVPGVTAKGPGTQLERDAEKGAEDKVTAGAGRGRDGLAAGGGSQSPGTLSPAQGERLSIQRRTDQPTEPGTMARVPPREDKSAEPRGAGPGAAVTCESCRGCGQPKSAELELKLMAPRRLRTCWGTGLSRGSTGSW